jgi:hypothetical protein
VKKIATAIFGEAQDITREKFVAGFGGSVEIGACLTAKGLRSYYVRVFKDMPVKTETVKSAFEEMKAKMRAAAAAKSEAAN